MKLIAPLIAITIIALCSSCTNNNQDTGGVDSASVSTDPSMGGSTDSGMTSSDSTDIRMPMADSTGNTGTGQAGSGSGSARDSSQH